MDIRKVRNAEAASHKTLQKCILMSLTGGKEIDTVFRVSLKPVLKKGVKINADQKLGFIDLQHHRLYDFNCIALLSLWALGCEQKSLVLTEDD